MTSPYIDAAGSVRIAYTRLEAAKGLLTKKVWVNDSGALEKLAAASPKRGVFTHIEHDGIADEIMEALSAILRNLTDRQAIIAAPLPTALAPDGEPWRLRLTEEPDSANTLSRSQSTFQVAEGPALGFLDFDVPAALRDGIASAEALYEKILLPAWPGFAETAQVIRPSVSSGARLIGGETPKPTGFHCFFVISDGRRLGALAEALFARLALNGFAVVEASRRGSMLRRALVDISASKGAERLIFEADPVLVGDGVRLVERPPSRFSGDVLDAERAIVDLTPSASEQRKLEALWVLAEETARPDCDAARETWIRQRARDIGELQPELPPETAYVQARDEMQFFDAGELTDDFQIPLDDGSCPIVAEILANPDRYKGKRGFSLDEPTPRRGVTFLWPFWCKADPAIGKPEGPYLSSFEHGGRFWRLRAAKKPAQAAAAGEAVGQTYELTPWNPWDRTGGGLFPLDVLSAVVRDWVEERAILTGADVSAFAMAALQQASGCLDHRFRVRPKQNEDYLIGPVLWTMLVGPPSTMKSAVVRKVTERLRKMDRREREDLERIAAQEAARGLPEAGGPVHARVRLVTDVTVEAVTDILSRQDCGTTLARDELAGWLNSMDRYGSGGDRAFWLETMGGGPYDVDRIKGQRHVNVLSVGIFGGIQPARLKDIDELAADGLLGRFIPVVMAQAGDEQDVPGKPETATLFERLTHDLGRLPPTVVTLDPEAQALYLAFSNDMRRGGRTVVPNEAFGNFAGKQGRTLVVLALLLHATDVSLDRSLQTEGGCVPIPAATVLRAQRIMEEFILPHAEFFYGMVTHNLGNVLSIAGAIVKQADKGVSMITARELGRHSRPIRVVVRDIRLVRQALTPFVVNGWLTPENLLPDNSRWRIHPGLAGRFRDEIAAEAKDYARMQAHIRRSRQATKN